MIDFKDKLNFYSAGHLSQRLYLIFFLYKQKMKGTRWLNRSETEMHRVSKHEFRKT